MTGQVRWYLHDGQRNVIGEVDPNGSVTASRKLDVFGNVRGGNNPGGTSKHKFQGGWGHLAEDETGLVYMRARYYDPLIGRFISEDPSGHGHNWFNYTNNNPVNGSDPSGRATLGEQVQTAATGAGMAAGGGGAVEAEQQMAARLGEAVQAHELEIVEWLEGGGDFFLRRVRNGIEISMPDGSSLKRVFIDMRDMWGHGGTHIDFQLNVNDKWLDGGEFYDQFRHIILDIAGDGKFHQ